MEAADVIIYLADATEKENPDDPVLSDSRCIAVLNKTDICDIRRDGFLNLSVSSGEGFSELCTELVSRLTSDLTMSDDSGLVIENERQKSELQGAVKALESAKAAVQADLPLDIVSLDIQEALQALGELTGEVTTDDILDRIFGSFCVGK